LLTALPLHFGGLGGDLPDLRFGHERLLAKPHTPLWMTHAEAGARLHAAGAEAERVGHDAVATATLSFTLREADVGVGAAEALGPSGRRQHALEAGPIRALGDCAIRSPWRSLA
jgi:hypothetical protein